MSGVEEILKRAQTSKAGGTVTTQKGLATQPEVEKVIVPSPAQLPVDGGLDNNAKVSVSIEYSRSMAYNKIGISLWASAPCPAGGEEAEAERLVEHLQPLADRYCAMAETKLMQWAGQ